MKKFCNKKTTVFTFAFLTFFLIGCAQNGVKKNRDLSSGALSFIYQNTNPNLSLPTGQKISLVNWNIFKCRALGFLREFRKLAVRSDIMLLQEMYLSDSFNENLQKEPFSSLHFVTAPSWIDDGDVPTGVATSSRYRIGDHASYISPVREPIKHTPKVSLFTFFDISGSEKKLLIGNAHAINFRGLLNNKAFKKHIDQIFAGFENHEGPAILGGDFNTWKPSRTRYLLQKASDQGFQLVDFENDERPNPLDYVFVRSVEIVKAQMLNKVKASDHIPQQLVFKLSP